MPAAQAEVRSYSQTTRKHSPMLRCVQCMRAPPILHLVHQRPALLKPRDPTNLQALMQARVSCPGKTHGSLAHGRAPGCERVAANAADSCRKLPQLRASLRRKMSAALGGLDSNKPRTRSLSPMSHHVHGTWASPFLHVVEQRPAQNLQVPRALQALMLMRIPGEPQCSPADGPPAAGCKRAAAAAAAATDVEKNRRNRRQLRGRLR
mmetsp:Transcript_133126/g.332335  ORF Transcript_133126/g.332335 Transcript_133126/m.332335 type:complete len:207 (-) Transcript_133126:814-1434(-)